VHQVGYIYKTNFCVTALSTVWNTALNVMLQALNLECSGVRYIYIYIYISLMKQQYVVTH